jgi:hypothetical protein
MLKRAWFVIAMGWAGLFLFNGFSKEGGIRPLDVILACAPFTLAKVVGFIVHGAKPRSIPYRPRN